VAYPSLIEDGCTGYLVPANDPYTLSAKILELSKHPGKAEALGKNARQAALVRHDKSEIEKQLLRIYNKLYHATAISQNI
jgi:glycosyltransferase involved in cell wall biosynthesis